jgi:hypothetical protein
VLQSLAQLWERAMRSARKHHTLLTGLFNATTHFRGLQETDPGLQNVFLCDITELKSCRGSYKMQSVLIPLLHNYEFSHVFISGWIGRGEQITQEYGYIAQTVDVGGIRTLPACPECRGSLVHDASGNIRTATRYHRNELESQIL